jgi:ribonucleotide monophosphatase NagD (HAD superfamily)
MGSSRQRRPPIETVAIAATSTLRCSWPMLCARTSASCGRRRRRVHVDAVIFGDMGRFTDVTLNAAFRMLMDGAELVALQHNRFYRMSDGLVPDVGEYAAALD